MAAVFAVVMERPELADDVRFTTNTLRLENRQALDVLIDERFRRRSRADVLGWLAAADLATGTVNDVPAVADHPQLAARQRWRTIPSPGGDIPALLPPHNLSTVTPCMGAVPALGEHTSEVLAELG